MFANYESDLSGDSAKCPQNHGDRRVHRLKKLRDACGLSLKELAAKTGVHFTVLSRIERGRIRLADHHIKVLAPALDADPAEFYAEPEEMSALDQEAINLIQGLPTEKKRAFVALLRLEVRGEDEPS